MPIPKEIIETVRRKVSLAELASDLPKIKRTGRGYTACCPFHEDSSPSFSINDEEGLFHCFGCGKKGTVFDYVMERRNLTFVEALKFLAAKVGVNIPEEPRSAQESKKQQQDKERRSLLREILSNAVNIYRQVLISPEGKYGWDYLANRGVGAEAIKSFQLGYAPPSWNFIEQALWKIFQNRFTRRDDFVSELIALGLIKIKGKGIGEQSTQDKAESEDGAAKAATSCYDVFRQRTIFPIMRSDGVPLALGGRILIKDKDQPKYINSPESLIYSKRSTLYGLAQALPAMRKKRHAYLVEGYLDVIGLHQKGVDTSVASCGTAVTEDHALLLKRLVNRVTALFDGDSAGRKAAAHCFPVFLNSGIEVDGILLPEGEDPDSFALKHSAEEVESYLEQHRVPILSIYLDELMYHAGLQDGAGSAVIGGKAAEQFVKTISVVSNAVEKEYLLKQASEKFGVSVESMLALLKSAQEELNQQQSYSANTEKPRRQSYTPRPTSYAPRSADRPSPAQREQPRWIAPRDNDTIVADCWQQLIVLLVRHPDSAKSICAQGIDQHELLNQGARAGVLSALCAELIAGAYVGLENSDNDESSVAYKRMQQVLTQHGTAATAVMKEAQRQVRVGAVDPDVLLADINHQLKRRLIQADVESMRKEEVNLSNDEDLLKLAQEKLMRRRSLEATKKE